MLPNFGQKEKLLYQAMAIFQQMVKIFSLNFAQIFILKKYLMENQKHEKLQGENIAEILQSSILKTLRYQAIKFGRK